MNRRRVVRVISLVDAHERRASIKKQLDERAIPFAFFDAVLGSRVREDANEMQKRFASDADVRWSRGAELRNGEIGCVLSHFKLWEEAGMSEENDYLIFEDDAMLTPEFDWNTRVPDDFDLVYFGNFWESLNPNVYREPVLPGTRIYKSLHALGTHAYLLSPKGARKLVEHYSKTKFRTNIDNELRVLFRRDYLTAYSIYPPVVWQQSMPLNGAMSHWTPSSLGYTQYIFPWYTIPVAVILFVASKGNAKVFVIGMAMYAVLLIVLKILVV